ncbi:MAG: hypothetical protein CVU39_06160 [Chloroflexi bacterium HGW-Chloroflexi-10]|nr:MAG: hypothetical protein CVU39_06160 [Chloroflexi bacterium HGW-Chloroflexi-10]
MGRKKRIVDIETPSSSPWEGEGLSVSKTGAASAGTGEGLSMSKKSQSSACTGDVCGIPDAVLLLAKELHEDPAQLLGWHVYPDKVVIVGRSGMKFSKAVSNGV